MPTDTRALTRAARRRATATGETYTEAREAVILIRALVDDGEFETFDDAQEWFDNPLNKLLCETCGWTNGMACPECPGACGCWTGRCTGWRHSEYNDYEDDPADREDRGCDECGAGNGPYDECQCD